MEIELEISGKEDKKAVAAILVDNGYTVRVAKVKRGKYTRCALIAEKGAENEVKSSD